MLRLVISGMTNVSFIFWSSLYKLIGLKRAIIVATIRFSNNSNKTMWCSKQYDQK